MVLLFSLPSYKYTALCSLYPALSVIPLPFEHPTDLFSYYSPFSVSLH